MLTLSVFTWVAFKTERGSFIVSLVCPLNIEGLVDNLSLFATRGTEVKTFTRKVTNSFLKSVDAILKTIDQDNSDFLKEDGVEVVSSNFCNSILEMKPEGDESSLELNVNISPLDSMPSPSLRAKYLIQKDYFPLIEQICKSLRPPVDNITREFYCKVKTLNGFKGEDGKMQGEAILTFIEDDQLIKGKVILRSDDYEIANQAHMGDLTISIKGQLEENPRTSKFSEYTSFKKLT